MAIEFESANISADWTFLTCFVLASVISFKAGNESSFITGLFRQPSTETKVLKSLDILFVVVWISALDFCFLAGSLVLVLLRVVVFWWFAFEFVLIVFVEASDDFRLLATMSQFAILVDVLQSFG